MKIIFAIIVIYLVSFSSFSEVKDSSVLGENEVVEKFDAIFYKPQLFGLRDMVCEVRIVGLTEKVKNRIGKKKMNDLYFRLYWTFPGRTMVEVIGLPSGFKELKNELSAVILGKIDLIFPKSLTDQFRSYKLSGSKSGNKYIVKGVDSTNMKDVSEAYLTFDNVGRLTKMRLLSPTGVRISSFNMERKGWSQNKYVINDMDIKINLGIQTTKIKQTLQYKKVASFGLPIRIVQNVTQRMHRPGNLKAKENITSGKSIMVFSNHVVNEGVAMRYIQRMTKKIKGNK
jgi:hypothetical protein